MSAILTGLGTFAKNMADDFLAHGIYDWIFPRKGEGPGRTINPEALRTVSPHFAKGKRDEARFQILLNRLSNSRRKALEVGFLSQLGANQLADFILSVAEVSHTPDPSDREATLQAMTAAVHFLERLADEDDLDAMKQMAVDRRFMRAEEGQYPIVILQNTLGVKFEDLPEFRRKLGQLARVGGRKAINAAKAVGPAIVQGLRMARDRALQIGDTAVTAIDNAADELALSLNPSVTAINNAVTERQAQRANRGFWGRLFRINTRR